MGPEDAVQLSELSMFVLIGIVAMTISMVLTPITIRLAPMLGMVDKPDERKVHTEAIPRVGGVGIVLGAVIPLFIWLPMDNLVLSILAGSLVLLLFGAWDDARELGPYVKFAGQIIAACLIVFAGDLYVSYLPLLIGVQIPEYVGIPFTIFAIVGMINALNLSDGLDGLAGGEALLSLCAIVYLGIQFQGDLVVYFAVATIGGIFGFLRFNSHPARVFMGDGGSQTLGFMLAVLVIYLSQDVNPVISQSLPVLLLGLPVIDALVVFYMRARRGDSLVVAARDHLHHRLLKLGLYHYESVMIIYSVQLLFVVTAVLIPYESDLLVLGLYVLISTLVFVSIYFAEHSGWKVRNDAVTDSEPDDGWRGLSAVPRLRELSLSMINTAVSVFLIVAAVLSTFVTPDIGMSSIALILLLFGALFVKRFGEFIYRLVLFMAIVFSVYLSTTYPPAWLVEEAHVVYAFFALLVVAGFLVVRTSQERNFQVTPMDYLVVLVVVVVALAPNTGEGASDLAWMGVQLIILFYVAELHIQGMRRKINGVWVSTLAALSILVARATLWQ